MDLVCGSVVHKKMEDWLEPKETALLHTIYKFSTSLDIIAAGIRIGSSVLASNYTRVN